MNALHELADLWALVAEEELQLSLLAVLAVCIALTAVLTAYIFSRARPVYLLNYSVYKPPEEWKISHEGFLDNSRRCGVSGCLARNHGCHSFVHRQEHHQSGVDLR